MNILLKIYNWGKNNSDRILLSKGSFWMVVIFCIAMLLPSCYKNDDIGDNYVTFTGEMMGEYLKARPEKFSEFTKFLDTAGITGLLDAYGKYTCFAPDNEAMYNFYQKRGHNSIKDFPYDSIVKIARDHIIKDFIVTSSDFRNGRIARVAMSDRYISTKPSVDINGLSVFYINETSPVKIKDELVHNGVVHIIGEVLQPTELLISEVIARDKKFTLFYEALLATGLQNLLTKIEDESYTPPSDFKSVQGIGIWSQVPLKRKYGYTVLIESDSTFKANGIETIEQLKAYAKTVYDKVYPNDKDITDITNRKNSLNRFIAYHLIEKQLGYTKFIYDMDNSGVRLAPQTHSIKTYDMFEYIETLCPNTLLEVRTLRNQILNEEYGIFNYIEANYNYVQINPEYKDKDAINGVYHEIRNILTYSREFVSELSTKRIRMDAASFFNELTNNNMRASKVIQHWSIPRGYLERLTSTENTQFNYYNSDDRFQDYQGDEIFMAENLYDFSVVTPPIPAGTYEIRFGFLNNGKRGIAQLYFDGQPCGIPLDLNVDATKPQIGFKVPGSEVDDPYGYQNDKMLRNRGYMKGPDSFVHIDKTTGWQTGQSARYNPRYIRRILGIFKFDEDGRHTFGVKAVQNKEFMFDFLEFVPTEYIEREGID